MGKRTLVGLLVLCIVIALPLTALAAPIEQVEDAGYGYTVFTIDEDGSMEVIDEGQGKSSNIIGSPSGMITPKAMGSGYCSISKSGKTVTVKGTTKNGSSASLKITVQIQKSSGGSWNNVSSGSASASKTGFSVSTSKSKSLSAGTYRCKATHTVKSDVFYSDSGSVTI